VTIKGGVTANARFRFHGELDEFLPRATRGTAFSAQCARAATLKNAIEALGVPHTEIARMTVNAAAATLDRIVRDNDVIEVFPWSQSEAIQPVSVYHFVADAHLGALARFLRMLGFDTVYDNRITDAAIRHLAQAERRIVLTRDRELLKCREIFFGCYVRALDPTQQLREIDARFGLAAHARPFTLCLRCNLTLAAVDKAQVLERLPEAVARCHERFYRCGGCNRVYWPGSHYARMNSALGRALGEPQA
jgi:uncharacterized protein with PIN domain